MARNVGFLPPRQHLRRALWNQAGEKQGYLAVVDGQEQLQDAHGKVVARILRWKRERAMASACGGSFLPQGE